jgi:hypothetical protein
MPLETMDLQTAAVFCSYNLQNTHAVFESSFLLELDVDPTCLLLLGVEAVSLLAFALALGFGSGAFCILAI